MAMFHLHAQVLSRASSQSAVAAAAYRHCATMTNAHYGEEHDYSRKAGNVHSEFVVPGNAPRWAREVASKSAVRASEAFWNCVEQSETRSDDQLAREMTLRFPWSSIVSRTLNWSGILSGLISSSEVSLPIGRIMTLAATRMFT